MTVILTMLTSSKFIKPELKSMEETQDKDFEGEDKSPNAEPTTKEPTAKELIIKKALKNH